MTLFELQSIVLSSCYKPIIRISQLSGSVHNKKGQMAKTYLKAMKVNIFSCFHIDRRCMKNTKGINSLEMTEESLIKYISMLIKDMVAMCTFEQGQHSMFRQNVSIYL